MSTYGSEELDLGERLRGTVVASTAETVIVLDRELRLVDIRGDLFTRHGLEREQMVGELATEVLRPSTTVQLQPLCFRALDGETLTVDFEPEDRLAVYEITFAPIEHQGECIGCVAVARDVTASRRGVRETEARNQLLEVMFNCAPIGVFVNSRNADGELVIMKCNPAFARLIGREPEEIVGHSSAEFLHPEDLSIRSAGIRRLCENKEATLEARWVHRDGREIWTQNSSAVVTGPNGEELHIIQCANVSDRKQREEQLRYHADHDSLTGLLTRRRFDEELAREISRFRRSGRTAAVLLIDLDGFKNVNDTQGHQAGDETLQEIARAFADTLRDHDVLARVGGDEFAAILPETGSPAALSTARRLVAAAAVRAGVTASIGVTTFRDQSLATPEELIAQADRAMYEAKSAGGNRVQVHEDVPERREAGGVLRRFARPA
ncbi:MAG TPA: diguanylate cyclase [Solirubrobacteraceae bacterium]|nr:diguanylate cyclase [Solirubrobacteraceae bacterium]